MSAYVVYQGEVTDPEQYDRYRALAGPSVAASGGRFIARGGATDPLEGDPPPQRTVLIEFPSMQAARDWYESVAYSDARTLRADAADVARMYIVDGG
jgi:uncharacterized protein (DUF1330 family)